MQLNSIPQDDAERCLRAREERNGTEMNGKEWNKTLVPRSKKSTPPAFHEPNGNGLHDSKFQDFREAYTAAGYEGIEHDWQEAQWPWNKLDWTQRLARIDAAKARPPDQASFLPKPRKFIETEWERKTRAPAQRAKPKSYLDQLAEGEQ